MIRRKFLVALSLLALAGAGVYRLQHGSWLSSRLRAPIQAALGRALGRDVRVGGVGGGFRGWLWLRDVEIGPRPGDPVGLSATAAAVGLKFDAWAVLQGRVDLASLEAVQLIAPRVFLFDAVPAPAGRPAPAAAAPAPPGPSAGSRPGPAWLEALRRLPLPPVPLVVERGELWGGGRGEAHAWVGRLYLGLDPRPGGGWRLRATGSPGGRGEASLSAACGPGFAAPKVSAVVRGLEWPAWLAFRGLSAPSGRLSGSLAAAPRPGAWPWGWDLSAAGTVEDAAFGPGQGRPGCSGVDAAWTLKGNRLSVTRAEGLCGRGRAQGRLEADLEGRTFGATLTAQGADLGDLAAAFGAPPNLGLSGAADLDLTAVGSFDGPQMDLRLRAEAARWQGHPLTGLALDASGSGGGWSADAALAWDGGSGGLSLDSDGGALSRATFRASSLPADWLDAFTGADLRGRLDGSAEYARDGGAWQVSLRGAKVEAAGLRLDSASLQAAGDANGGRARLESGLPGRPGLNAALDLGFPGGSLWVLKSARLFQRSRLLARASGSGRLGRPGAPAELSLTARTESVDVALIAPDLAAGGWKGCLRAQGTLRYASGAWSGSAHVSSPSLARGAWGYPGSADLAFGASGVGVTLASLRGGELSGSFHAPGWRGPWSARLDLSRARLAAYAALDPGAPRGVSGWAGGRVDASAEGAGLLRARLAFADPLPGVLPGARGRLDLERHGALWSLHSLRLTQPGGGLEGGADWDFSGARPWTGQFRWKGLALSGRRDCSGAAALSGGGGVPGRLRISPWSVSGTALPDLEASFLFGAGALREVRGLWGRESAWSLRNAAGRWEARAAFKEVDPGALALLALGRGGASIERLGGNLRATLSPKGAPLDLDLELEDQAGGRFKGRADWVSGTAALRGTVRALNLAHLADVARPWGWSFPAVAGEASGSVQGGGGALTLTATVDRFALGGRKLGALALELGWDGGALWIPSASLGTASGPFLELTGLSWRGRASAWTAAGGLRLRDWPLGLWTVGGSARAQAWGAAGKLRWRAKFDPLLVGLRRWPQVALSGSWDRGAFRVQEASRPPAFTAAGSYAAGAFSLAALKAYSGGGSGTLSGRLGADGSLDFSGLSQGLPAADLAGIMGWPQSWSGSAWGSLKVSGTVGRPRTVVSAKVEDGSVDGLPFDLGTATVVQDGDWVDLSPQLPIRISRRDGTALEVGGRVTLLDHPGPGRGMDVWAELRHGGLRLFSGLPAIRSADGPMTLKLRFTGDPADPRVDGSFLVTDGTADPAWLLPPLERVRILAQISDSRVDLEEAEASVRGDGRILRLEAADPGKPAFVFRDWVPADMNLRVRASRSGVPLRFTPALSFASGTAHPDLLLSGTWDSPALSGSVSLDKGGADKALVNWPPQFRGGGADAGPASWFDRLDYHVVLKARSDVMVRTGAAEVFVDTGDKGLLVSGAGPAKSVYGHVRLAQGSVDYLLATFQLDSGHESWVEMRGAQAPELELWGLDELGDVQVSGAGVPEDIRVLLHAWGPVGQVQMRLVDEDDPSLTQDQLAGLLGFGSDSGDSRSQGGFTRMLTSVPAGLLSSWARKSGLVDEVNVSVPMVDQALAPTPGNGSLGMVQPVAGSAVSGTGHSMLEVSAGRYLGSKIFVGVNTQVIQRPQLQGGTAYDPDLGGVVQYQLPGQARISAERNIDATGVADNRIMLEGTSQFDNYDPNQRRWDGTPTPTPAPSPTPLPPP